MGSAEEADRGLERDPVTPGDLSLLPVELLREFSRMLRRGRSVQLIELIERFPPDQADLARTLGELVRIHQFDKLLALAEGALKENSNSKGDAV
jgi:hypothetical protein